MIDLSGLPHAPLIAVLATGGGLLLLSFVYAGRRRPEPTPGEPEIPLPPLVEDKVPSPVTSPALAWRLLGVDYFASPQRAALITLAGCLGLFVLVVALFGWPLVGALGALAVGLTVPRQLASSRREADLLLIEEALAESVALLRDFIRGGNTIPGSIHELARTAPPLMRPHFAEIDGLLASGVRLDVALATLQERLQHNSFDVLAQSIITAVDAGGQNLSMIMDELVAQLREGVSAKRAARSAQTQSVLTARGLCVLPLLLFLAMRCNSADVTAPYSTTTGQLVLCGIIVLVLTGYVLMMRVARPLRVPRLMRPRAMEDDRR